jgi:hypothetical protein
MIFGKDCLGIPKLGMCQGECEIHPTSSHPNDVLVNKRCQGGHMEQFHILGRYKLTVDSGASRLPSPAPPVLYV